MAQKPLATEVMQKALDAVLEHGGVGAAAKALGENRSTIDHRYKKAMLNGLHLSAGAKDSVSKAGLGYMEGKGGHRRVYDEETGKHIDTVRWTADPVQLTETYMDRMREAFEGMTPAPPVPRPSDTRADLCNVLPLFDVHWGMSAWGEETGGPDYDLTLARDDMMRGVEAVLGDAPRADTCLLILGGDFLHADDSRAETPASKHKLDMAASQHQAIDSGIAIMKHVVTRVLELHDKAEIRVLRGNHDPHSHKTIAFALREWLGQNDRATVDMTPAEIYMKQWGRASIFAQHGDKMKPTDLALKLSDICPFWTEAPHRYAYTGHKHSLASQRIGGLNWERLEPFAPTDTYGASWVNRRAMKLDTYHKKRGRTGTVIDPLERE